MASRYYYGAIVAATLAVSVSDAAEEFAPLEETDGGRKLNSRSWSGGWGGWASDGWSSSSSSGKSGKSGGSGSGSGSSKSGKGSSASWSGDGWNGGPPSWHGPWQSSSSSGKSGKSGGSKGSKGSSSSYDGPGWGPPPSWHGGWSSSSSSSSKSGKSGGSKGSKGSWSSSFDHWGPPPSWHGGWHSSSGKSGKSGGSKGSKGSSSSFDHWGPPPSWHGPWHSSSSSSSKSGKSSGSKGSKGSSFDHWGPPPYWHGGWSSSSGKSGKSGSSKGSKGSYSSSHDGWYADDWAAGWSSSSSGKSGKSSSSSHDHGYWGGPSSSGKSGKSSKGSKSGSSGHWVWVEYTSWDHDGFSGKSGKSGSSSSSSSDDDNWASSSSGDWDDDGWASSSSGDWDDDGYYNIPEPIYTVGGSVGGWKADGWDNDGHYKADIDYVRAEVRKLIDDSERELIPKFLRLGFHDCVGGCDGCVDMDNPDNKGLQEPIEAIYPIVEQFKASYSRADIWALATLVSADMSLLHDRPYDLTFPMRYFGRKDCHGSDLKGVGGPDVNMPSNDFTTHELLDFFEEYFGFDMEETVTIMGVHSVGVAHRTNSGYGNKGKEDGWVFDAESYVLNNRYYGMLVGNDDDDVDAAPMWHLELVKNDDGIPDRYQWYHERDGEDERPIMTNADMALVLDFEDHIYVDKDGNEGAVDCLFKEEKKSQHDDEGGYRMRRTLQYNNNNNKKKTVCPIASNTIEKMLEYKMDNELFLYDFEKVLEKMVKNGY